MLALREEVDKLILLEGETQVHENPYSLTATNDDLQFSWEAKKKFYEDVANNVALLTSHTGVVLKALQKEK